MLMSFPKRSMTSANAVIVNQNIPRHQFRLSIRWEAAYTNQLLITGTVSYSNTYIVPMGTFCGTLIFPGMVRDFCNELIDNRHIPRHQFPPLHKMGSSVCHSVSDNQSIYVFQYPDLYPEEYFYGVRMFSTKEYTRSLPIQLLLTNIFPNTSYHLSIRWEAAYANRLLITGTVLYSDTCICISREC